MNLKTVKYKYLLTQYKNNIYGYALYMVKEKMDAEDITQEAMIRIWENMGKFKMLSAKAWIMRTTHNLCIDFLRRKNLIFAKIERIDEEKNYKYVDTVSSENTVAKIENEIINEQIKKSLQNLPANLKSVFVLYEIEKLKYKEISIALGMPINSVKVYLLRARKKLQEELKNYERD